MDGQRRYVERLKLSARWRRLSNGCLSCDWGPSVRQEMMRREMGGDGDRGNHAWAWGEQRMAARRAECRAAIPEAWCGRSEVVKAWDNDRAFRAQTQPAPEPEPLALPLGQVSSACAPAPTETPRRCHKAASQPSARRFATHQDTTTSPSPPTMAPPSNAPQPGANGVLPVPAAALQKNTAHSNSNGAPRAASNRSQQPRLKLVVRRLAPGLTQQEFELALGDEWKLGQGKVDWFTYKAGKISKECDHKPHCFLTLQTRNR